MCANVCSYIAHGSETGGKSTAVCVLVVKLCILTLFPKSMDAESSKVWEEMWEGRDSECSESGESSVVTYSEPSGSLYIATPDRPRTVERPIDLPAKLYFLELS